MEEGEWRRQERYGGGIRKEEEMDCLINIKFSKGRRYIVQYSRLESVEGSYYPRVPECLSLRPNWHPSPPLPPASMRHPPFGTEGGQHSLAGEGREKPTSDDCRESLALCLLMCYTVKKGLRFSRPQPGCH
jgi:hypothetical protein